MPSPPTFLPAHYGLMQAGVRSVSWATGLVAIMMLGYVGRTWPDKGQVIVAGLMGVCCNSEAISARTQAP